MLNVIQRSTTLPGATKLILCGGGAFALAEAFYKFGSFSLECVAFLATWAAFEGIWHATESVLRKKSV